MSVLIGKDTMGGSKSKTAQKMKKLDDTYSEKYMNVGEIGDDEDLNSNSKRASKKMEEIIMSTESLEKERRSP